VLCQFREPRFELISANAESSFGSPKFRPQVLDSPSLPKFGSLPEKNRAS